MRDFTLTESICDQAALVSAKSKGWKEWFANPTAGPWKRIVVPGVPSLHNTGFQKNETRPDLVLYHKNLDSKILILESKDNIDKVIDSANKNKQIKKTCEVFLNIKNKLDLLIKSSTDKDLVTSLDSINYIPGYVVANRDDISTKITELKKLHFKFIDKSVFPYFIIIIIKKSNYDLTLETQIISEKPDENTKSLQGFFQTGF